jgi:hypothetical protein
MSHQALSNLLDECGSALRLFRFRQKVYDTIVDDCPEVLREHIRAVNGYIYDVLQDLLEDELTKEETLSLCALIEGLKEDRGGKLW